MERIRTLRGWALAGGLVAVLAVPGAARASSVNVSSSMSGFCIGSDCSIMRFIINLPANQAWVDRVVIFNHNPSRWKFYHLLGANDAQGKDLGWSSDALGDDFLVRSPGPIGEGPVQLTIQMSQWGDNPWNNNFDFQGEGDPTLGGTVTPEPASMILLGTGLAGIAGAARRRRIRKLSDV